MENGTYHVTMFRNRTTFLDKIDASIEISLNKRRKTGTTSKLIEQTMKLPSDIKVYPISCTVKFWTFKNGGKAVQV